MADTRRLPVPVAELWDWQMHGACRDLNSDLFFHPERERGPSRAAREARAKAVCRSCPVLQQCRTHALAVREPYGVWGGLSEAERTAQLRLDAVERNVVIDVDFRYRDVGRSRSPSEGPRPA